MTYNKKEIAIIEAAQQTHINWADYFRKWPLEQKAIQHQNVGNIEHHRKYIRDYDKVLHKLKTSVPVSVVVWLLLLMFLFGVYAKYMIQIH